MGKLKNVIMYSDGACIGNPGPGGYGVVLLYKGHRKELSGGFRLTTNNRMEIMAAIIGLHALRTRCAVEVITDSQLLINTMTKGWARAWRRNDWKKRNKEKVLNADLWAQLLQLCDYHRVSFLWTQSHAGDPENERCDKLAREAAQQEGLPSDSAYEGGSQKPLTP